ncbi:MAG: ATP-binding protein [Firmicutes bacterium]|nr:ATP-binding protein [Bacillota bacterium]
MSARYERGRLILTSNTGFADWGDVLGDPVIATDILDRLLHHSHGVNIRGDCDRLNDKKRAGLWGLRGSPPHLRVIHESNLVGASGSNSIGVVTHRDARVITSGLLHHAPPPIRYAPMDPDPNATGHGGLLCFPGYPAWAGATMLSCAGPVSRDRAQLSQINPHPEDAWRRRVRTATSAMVAHPIRRAHAAAVRHDPSSSASAEIRCHRASAD